MDLRQLQALVAVAEHGTFSSAAASLHTVQSNVSAHIARLERELGTTLVDRSAGRLTEEGHAVLARARRVGAELEALVADVAALRYEVSGTVRVGMTGTTGRWLVGPLLRRLDERHPGIHPIVVEGTSASLEPRLAAGDLDLAVVNLPVPGHDLLTEPLFTEDLLLVVHVSDPRAARSRLPLGELADVELLLPVPGSALRDEVDAATRRAGVQLRCRAELDGVRFIASLTFEGLGPSILPATAVPSYLRDTWRGVPIYGLPPRLVGVAVRRRGLPSAPARATRDVLQELIEDQGQVPSGVHPVAAGPAAGRPAGEHRQDPAADSGR